MKIIHKYVLREHVGPLVFALSAITSLMLLNYVAKQLGNLVGKGLGWDVIGEFFALSIPFTVAMTLPMAVLVSVLYAFSRLAAENEITALKSTGVSIRRLLVPVAIGGAFMTLFMVIFNDQVLPRANHRLRTLQGDIARKKPTFAIKEQIINEVSPQQFFLRTNHLDRATNLMREVTIYDLSDPLRRRTIYADSGEMAFASNGGDLQLTLYHGVMQEIPRDTPTQLQRLFYNVDLVRVRGVINQFQRDSGDLYKSDREMSVCELQNEVGRWERDYYRAYDEYNNAKDAFAKNKASTVNSTVNLPALPGSIAPRSRRASLGRTYCDGLLFLEKRGMGRLTMLSSRASDLVLPSMAYAQAPQQKPAVQKPARQPVQKPVPAAKPPVPAKPAAAPRDTVRPKTDTVRAPTPAQLAARRDSMRKAMQERQKQLQDSVAKLAAQARTMTPEQAKALESKPTVVQGQAPTTYAPKNEKPPEIARPVQADTTPVVAAPVAPPKVDSAPKPPPIDTARSLPLGAPGVAPSSGVVSVLPANVAMEASRGNMLAAREQMNQYEVEIQKKFAISAACVVFVLLGAPLALRFPRGGVGLVIGVSLIVFALYYVGLIAGEALADRTILTPFWSMWAANILFLVTGIYLLARVEITNGSARGGDLAELIEGVRYRLAQRRKASPAGRKRPGTATPAMGTPTPVAAAAPDHATEPPGEVPPSESRTEEPVA